ncbi:TIGR04222 domain-containing membrane protein [Streptomyces sp. NPDC006984]|uniref:TIGR04222 domain-containing membrane protein n=1 Tax=Streptomyces sp. NPDC006984 TaxID=3155463 RepID=UPI00340C424C
MTTVFVIGLLYYLVLLGLSGVLLVGTRRSAGGGQVPPGHHEVRDLFEAAFLSGGPSQVANTVIAAMQSDGLLTVASPGVVAVHTAAPRNDVEAALLQVHSTAPIGSLAWVRANVMRSPAVQGIGEELARRGLLLRPSARAVWKRRAQALQALCAVGGVLALLLTLEQYLDIFPPTREEEDYSAGVPLLPAVLPAVITALLVGARCAAAPSERVSPAGKQALAAYWLRTGHVTGVAQAVAMNGPVAVPDPELRALLVRARRHGSSEWGGLPLIFTHYTTHRTPYTEPDAQGHGGHHATTTDWCGGGGAAGGCGCATACGGGNAFCSVGGAGGGAGAGGSGCAGAAGGSGCASGGSSCGGGSGCASGGSSCGGGSSCASGGGSASSCGGGSST